MCCLDQAGRKALGLEKQLLPIFVPLRKVENLEQRFCAALSQAASNRNKPIPAEAFEHWLEAGSLVLLDGLDELSTVAQRRAACKWIDEAVAAYGSFCFIVTSRFTGYRASDDVELRTEHKRGEVLDLDSAQQETFLKKWFAAAYRENGEAASASKAEQAQQVATAVRDYLKQPENESLRRLAGTPVLLQIMAILWKEYGSLVSGRGDLYEKCTDYLLDRRDRVRDLPPPLPAGQAKIVLRPLALFMQETLKTHDIRGEELAARIERVLEEVKPGLKPETFIEHLRDRAALLKAFGEGRYVFSHNSFREFLAAGELAEQIKRNPERSRVLVENFTECWWRETILFCLSLSKPVIFAEFFERFLPHANNVAGFPELLQHGLKEAQHKPIAPFENFLLDQKQDAAKRYSALLCLRAIASEPAKALVKQVWEQEEPNQIKQKAEELLLEWKLVREAKASLAAENSFRNPFELNAEYILIPGGKYKYSVTKQEVEVPAIYFAKYPVTNKLYRRFIAGMEHGAWGKGQGVRGMEQGAWGELTRARFAESLLREAEKIAEFVDYLDEDPEQWADKLRSHYDDDKRFNDEEQPVVGVSWFAATAYCHWQSELQGVEGEGRREKGEGDKMIFRLPTEVEWEWAASGGERKYPWGTTPERNEKLANFDEKVGQTTPVGSYPDGATPEGLMDMAGNVWEWCENLYGHEKYKEARALRGGSWGASTAVLPCAVCDCNHPVNLWTSHGFRVVAGQS
jgi:formylglycine-generating enzyme required for sulfatase activity